MAKEYISLKEATKYCPYSKDYLKLRARQGKLKALKFGRNWVTTKEWLREYLERVSQSNFQVRQIEELVSRGEKKSSLYRYFRYFLPFLIILLIMIFIILGGMINFPSLESILEKIIPPKIIEIER